jgi:hypothetical protein
MLNFRASHKRGRMQEPAPLNPLVLQWEADGGSSATTARRATAGRYPRLRTIMKYASSHRDAICSLGDIG